MALKQPFSINPATGQVAANAYWRVQEPSWRKTPGDAFVEVWAYFDQAAAAAGKEPLVRRRYGFAGAALAAVIQAPLTADEQATIVPFTPYTWLYSRIYHALKQLPDFTEATDVLEARPPIQAGPAQVDPTPGGAGAAG